MLVRPLSLNSFEVSFRYVTKRKRRLAAVLVSKTAGVEK